MKTNIRNVLAVLAGLVVGSLVNMGLVSIGPKVIPLPEGADNSSMEGLKSSMHLFTAKHFIFPFLGHALGTLAGAFVVAKLAANHKMKLAIGIGVLFLAGGIMAVSMIGGPLWFNLADLVLAYIPMGFLGGYIASRKR